MVNIDWSIILNIINIIVLYFLMKRFLFGPINKIMEKRTNVINQSFLEADNKNKEANKLKKEYEDRLLHAKDEANLIIKDAIKRASDEETRQLNEAKVQIARMMEETNQAIQLEKKKTMEEMQSEIASLALTTASKILQQNIDPSKNSHIINDFINEVGTYK